MRVGTKVDNWGRLLRLWRSAAIGGINLLNIINMHIVYILQSQINKKYYIGHTKNLDQRLKQHNSGKVKSTKNAKPWEIIYSEKYKTKSEAYRREIQIKAYKGGRAFRNLIRK